MGVQTKTVEQDIKTHVYLDVNSITIISQGNVSEGDVIYIQASIVNPTKAKITHVEINGIKCKTLASSTAEQVFVEIICDEEMGCGSVALSIGRIYATKDDTSYSIKAETVKEDEIFINGNMQILSAAFVDSEGKEKYYFVDGERMFIKLLVDNPADYTVNGIRFSEDGEVLPRVISVDRISRDEWMLEVEFRTWLNEPIADYGHIKIGESMIICYGNEEIYKEARYNGSLVTTKIYSEKRTVSSPNDLMNIEDGYYYELTCDIDLGGINWTPKKFTGIINGNGYSVKNLSILGVQEEDGATIGLFSYLRGSIFDLCVEKALIMISGAAQHQSIYAGCIAGINYGSIINCSVDDSSVIAINSDGYAGGIVYSNDGIMINCVNNASVTVVSENSNSTCFASGIADYNNGIMLNCVNNGAVHSSEKACGIAKGNSGIMNACVNNADVLQVANYFGCASGIVGSNSGIMTECTNRGNVQAVYSASGIVIENYHTVENCINQGNLSAKKVNGIALVNQVGAWFDPALAWNNPRILNCINTGTLTGEEIAGICYQQDVANSSLIKNCINIGEMIELEPEDPNEIWIGTYAIAMPVDNDKAKIENCFALFGGKDSTAGYVHTVDGSQINSKRFYVETLGWSEDIWDFSDLDVENGKCPKLK